MPLSQANWVLSPTSANWPSALRELPDAPGGLHGLGVLPGLSLAVAIVGTRKADAGALQFAHALGEAVARAGGVVLSGGAQGIDAAAHQGALAGGGKTVAVLASSLERPYPPANTRMFQTIVEAGGALLSENASPVEVNRWHFLARNRLVAALARAVVVVQAPLPSGALTTAAWAKRLDRALWVVPAAPWDVRGQGGLTLLRQGAQPCCQPAQVLASLGLKPPRRRRAAAQDALAGLSEEQKRLMAQLGSQPQHVDELAVAVGLSAAQAQASLLSLVLQGVVQPLPGGLYARMA